MNRPAQHAAVGKGFRDPGQKILFAAFLIALSLHLGVAVALTQFDSEQALHYPGEQEFVVDLALGEHGAEFAEPEQQAPDEPEMTDTLPEESPPPEETVEAPAEDIPVNVALPDPAPSPVILPPKVERPVKAAPKLIQPPRQRIAATNTRKSRAPIPEGNIGGAGSSADPNELNRYVKHVAAMLNRRLRYPPTAKDRGISGSVTIRFVMHRSGRVISATIVRGTGNALLDQAALATAAPGSSLLPAPASIPQDKFAFVVPLRFLLN